MKKISTNQLQKKLSEVNNLLSRGGIEISEKILYDLSVCFPSHPEVLSKLGTVYLYKNKLADGIQLIEKSLEINPYQPDILNNYAVALLNTNQPKNALDIITKAIKIKPDYIEAHYHRGLICKSLGLLNDALNAYEKTIELMPSHENAILNSAAIYIQLKQYNKAITILNISTHPNPSAGFFYNLGLAHLKLENLEDAIKYFSQAINIHPNYIEAWDNLSLAKKKFKDFEGALYAIDKVISIDNQYPDAYNNKGLILIELCIFDKAILQFKFALKFKYNLAEIFNNIGICYSNLKKFKKAIENYSSALELNPSYVYALNNRGLIYQELLDNEKALLDFNQAIKIDNTFADAYNSRGLLLKNMGFEDKAVNDIKHAIKLNPDLEEANISIFTILIKKFDFKNAWAYYEKRTKVSDFLKKTKALNKIYLNKIPEDHEPILIYSEQGLGDQIIYLSLLHEIVNWPNPILVQINPRLIPLFKRSFTNISLYSDKENLSPSLYKYHTLIGSIPQFFRNSKESFFNQKKSFLVSDQNKTSILRKQLTVKEQIVCGIAWKSKNEKFGHFKTASLDDFLPILKLPSINFVDLQYGDTSIERSDLKNNHDITLTKIDEIDNFNDIDSLASLIDACDFIVTISNVTAHIAGALGKKVFLMVPYEKGKIWYWHDGLKISLWYPSIQIFTQTETGDWTKPMTDIKEKLIGQTNHG